MNMNKEKFIYVSFVLLMVLVHSTIPFTRYAIYLLPFLAILVWFVNGEAKLNFNKIIAPFALLFFLSVLSLIPWDFNTFKKAYFIFVFTSVFLLFDFKKADIDFRKLGLFFVGLGVFWLFVSGSGVKNIDYDLLDSRSAFESTFAFPIGLLSLYFFVTRKYLWGLVFFLCSALFLKRIVLIAIILSVIAYFLPSKIRKVVLNPWSITFSAVSITVFSIIFSFGYFDDVIVDLTGRSANDLSKGRQDLWSSALLSVGFTYDSFILWGVGIGKVVSNIEVVLDIKGVLLHSDLLSLVLEVGFLFYIAFVYLLNAVRRPEQRAIALFLTILFTTDNVLIYQHLMFVYLLIQQDLSDRGSDNDSHDAFSGVSKQSLNKRILRFRREAKDKTS